MTHFHCLHGAWHGSWVWDKLKDCLIRHGHTVTAPDLPGLGALASHNALEQIDLEQHINAATPNQPCILIGHSYAGMLVRALCDRSPDYVNKVILIEALWPQQSGQTVFDLLPEQTVASLTQSAQDSSGGISIPPPPTQQFAINNEAIEQMVSERLTPQPQLTYQQPLYWSSEAEPGMYIMANDRSPQPYQETADFLQTQAWEIVTMAGGHELMLTASDNLCNLLSNIDA